MAKPDFFIVGAPKSGTTALSEYLRSHSDIFISIPKEPHFFSEDFPSIRYADGNLDAYMSLFDEPHDYSAYGEASVYYLYSSVALKKIIKFNPEAKIIAMLRNPVDLVCSLHSQFLHSRSERIKDFEKAWRSQKARREGKNIARLCFEPKLLQYTQIGKLGEQVDRLLSIFPTEQVKIIYFEDFCKSTKDVYESVLAFLGIKSDGKFEFPKINVNRAHRIGIVGTLTARTPNSVLKITSIIKKIAGIERFGILDRIRIVNTVTKPRVPLSHKLRREMVKEFKEDLLLLSHLTNRDLSGWLT